MAININLKEVFSNDSAGDISSKLNFNFNQLLALGVGQGGLPGETGSSGSAGPIGPTGLPGTNGPAIWSSTSGSTSALGASSPANSVVGDYYISDTAIYKKNTAGTDWEVITNFSNIFNAVSVAGTVSWQTGINSSAISRLIVNTRNSNGIDRITTLGTSGNYTTNFPNWKASDATSQNSQATLFNFDANTVKYYIAGSADTNGYTVTPTTLRAGNALTDEVFPYTSLLSLYSFFNSADAPTESSQYSGNIGYRHQLELGSVDELTEGLHGTAGTSSTYVVSPTYQNLRIRKYRMADTSGSFGGNSVILTDFNLHAADGVTTPALTSKMKWRVNKKTSATNSTGSVITMTLNPGITEASSSDSIKTSSISGVDGIHLVSSEGPFNLAIGFDSTNITNSTKKAIISSDSTNTLTSITFAKLPITVTNDSANITLATTGITSNSAITISSTATPGAGSDNIVLSTNSGGDIGLYSGTSGNSIRIGGTKANPAITISNTRLASAIPFATSTGTIPTYSSDDANTLDEYQEGTFVPTVSYLTFKPGTPGGIPASIPPGGTGILSAANPTINANYGIYTKIGKLIQFTLKFSISNWYITNTSSATTQAPLNAFTSYDNIDKLDAGNIAQYILYTDIHKYSTEQFQLAISGLPNHWPDLEGTGQSGYGTSDMHFKVSLNPRNTSATAACIRTFPMDYSYGGTGGVGTSGTLAHPFEALDQSSIYAKFVSNPVFNPGVSELRLYGNRKSYSANPAFLNNVSGIRSNVSVYDFLTINNQSVADGNTIDVVISGSYLTNHKTVPTD
jgi:hypothetical protein